MSPLYISSLFTAYKQERQLRSNSKIFTLNRELQNSGDLVLFWVWLRFLCLIGNDVTCSQGVTTGYILPIGYSVLLPWIQTSLSKKPEIAFN